MGQQQVRGDINIGSAHSPISTHGRVFGRAGGTTQGHANRPDLSLTLEGTTKTNKGIEERGCATEFSTHEAVRARNNMYSDQCNYLSPPLLLNFTYFTDTAFGLVTGFNS